MGHLGIPTPEQAFDDEGKAMNYYRLIYDKLGSFLTAAKCACILNE